MSTNFTTAAGRDLCEVCGKLYRCLMVHQRAHHAAEWRYTCAHCDKGFRYKNAVAGHCATHTGETPFACDMCAMRYTRADALRRHIRWVHEADRPHRCDVCACAFACRGHLTKHRKRMHAAEKCEYACHVCDMRFARADQLRRHIVGREVPPAAEVDRPHRCDVCGKKFARVKWLEKHGRRHDAEKKRDDKWAFYDCDVCGRKFADVGARDEHRKQQHAPVRPFPCDVCGVPFTVSGPSRMYRDGPNPNQRPYRCHSCFNAASCSLESGTTSSQQTLPNFWSMFVHSSLDNPSCLPTDAKIRRVQTSTFVSNC